ncbi:PREDICTED: U1 small nuclear ribonucleoprotein C-like [Ficedula albicollis]|uniref:U1 small nuclear ribonucleoprotein C-like n=1 Tax=Ficedula albicollis TaxID=59894 RepID=UPI0007AD8970|nr:PREDICTED: U1 small nuclear ribonucleoprotein C-like [Ficedula albicollis]
MAELRAGRLGPGRGVERTSGLRAVLARPVRFLSRGDAWESIPFCRARREGPEQPRGRPGEPGHARDEDLRWRPPLLPGPGCLGLWIVTARMSFPPHLNRPPMGIPTLPPGIPPPQFPGFPPPVPPG